MKGQNSGNSGRNAAPAVAKNSTNATQKVKTQSKLTQPAEISKQSLRVKTWKKIKFTNCGVSINALFNRIPVCIDSDKAANLLTQTNKFKNAKNIKVDTDRALYFAKIEVLTTNKTLYLSATRKSRALFLRVDVPENATTNEKKKILDTPDAQYRTEISLANKVKLDMIVIGSVVVSRDGYRIGQGHGFADLDIGFLIEVGAITPETTIVTMVHDVQVVNTLPTKLFQKYDIPVDVIVTPTKVIHVAKRLPRPAGIFWELLSKRRLENMPALQELKENLEKSGKIVALKEENSDPEEDQRRNRCRRRGPELQKSRFAISQTENEQQGGGNNNEQQNSGIQQHREHRNLSTTKSEDDQSDVENKSLELKPQGRKQTSEDKMNKVLMAVENLSLTIKTGDGAATSGKSPVTAYGEGKQGGENTAEDTAPQEAKIIDVNEEKEGEAQAIGVDKETGNDATNSRIALENLSLNITTGDGDAKPTATTNSRIALENLSLNITTGDGDANPTAGKNGVAADGEGKEGDESTTEDTAPQEAKIIDVNEANEGEAQANGVDKETGNDAINSRIALENLSLNITTGDGDANPTAGKNGVAADGEGKEGDESTTEDTAPQEAKIIDVNEENEGEAQANGVDKETGNDAINSRIALENLSLNITTGDGDANPTAGKNGVAADGEGKEGDESTTEDTAPQEAKIIDVNEENEGEAQTNGDTTTVLGENVRSK